MQLWNLLGKAGQELSSKALEPMLAELGPWYAELILASAGILYALHLLRKRDQERWEE